MIDNGGAALRSFLAVLTNKRYSYIFGSGKRMFIGMVVIGRNWRAPSAHTAKSRLFDPADWVRAEIEAAFDQGKHVIPVLVAGANMCIATELPKSIARLSKLQAFKMTDRHWDDDIQDLVQLLLKAVPELRAESAREQLGPAASPAMTRKQVLAGASCPSRANQFTGAKGSKRE